MEKLTYFVLVSICVFSLNVNTLEDTPTKSSNVLTIKLKKTTFGMYTLPVNVGSDNQTYPLILSTMQPFISIVSPRVCTMNPPVFSVAKCFHFNNSDSFMYRVKYPNSFSVKSDQKQINFFHQQSSDVAFFEAYTQIKNNTIYVIQQLLDQDSDPYQFFDETSGIIGFGYNSESKTNKNILFSTLMLMKIKLNTVLGWGFDLSSNLLHLGGYLPQEHGEITWGETQIDFLPEQYEITLFHFSFCGNVVLKPTSSFTFAKIDTVSNCLRIPKNILFKNVIEWFPLKCNNSYCEYNEDQPLNLNDLPSFSFSLSENGKKFFIPLESLYLKGEKFCIIPDNENDYFTFGNLALQNFYVAIDINQKRLGLHQSNSIDTEKNILCSQKKKCIGKQEYFQPSNKCLEPDCNKFFFHTLDKKKHVCIKKSFFIIFFYSVIVFLFIAELFVYLKNNTLIKKIKEKND
ncbi:beta-site app-cleaving enzyme [Anaeramoeba flamelloides]|uniref:Beta-site app-cleaving enzyme n=1 Tax=Anaeramoeba flamelloides TaxID=1746091 RepID=A0ABQ8XK16_9EUKA|nr:beta-site app-cleaving enzyme [Anaeramoeba flamelloides]